MVIVQSDGEGLLNEERLSSLIESSVRKALQENLPKDNYPETDSLLSVKEAAQFLKLTVPTIYSKVSRGELPSMKRSKRLYFSREDLINYIQQGRRKSNAEIEAEAKQYLVNRRGGKR